MSESPSVASTPSEKRKASQIGGGPSKPGPGLVENRVVPSDPETRTATAGGGKRLKRSYAFCEPLDASKRPNVTRGKQIYSCHTKSEPPTKQGMAAQSQFNHAVTVTKAAVAAASKSPRPTPIASKSLRKTPMASTPPAQSPGRRTEEVLKLTNRDSETLY